MENDELKGLDIWNLVLILRPIRSQYNAPKIEMTGSQSSRQLVEEKITPERVTNNPIRPGTLFSKGKHLTSQDRHLFIFPLNFPRCVNDSLIVHFIQDFTGHLPYSGKCGSHTGSPQTVCSYFVPGKVNPGPPGTAGYPQTSVRLHANHVIQEAIPNGCRKER